MVDVAKNSKQVPTYYKDGSYVSAMKYGNSWYGVDENGKPIKLDQALLHFADKNYENPLIEQTKGFIAKREARIELNEQAIVSLKSTYNSIKEKLGEYLTSLGIDVDDNRNSLNGIQRMKVNDFEYNMSKTKKSINLADMSIRGDLLSNFSDWCSIMGMS